jgi:hypothetical protein
MHFVAIDFSLNSPGICAFNSNTEKYTFISYLKPGTGTKKEQKIQEDFAALNDSIFMDQPDFSNNEAYSGSEFHKVLRYLTTATDIISLIEQVIPVTEDVVFAFEGTSFGSKMGTNNIIDMAAGAAILKLKLLENFNVETIETVAPSTIKKHAGKGNMNKGDLWTVFRDHINNDSNRPKTETFLFCQNEIGKIQKIPKPFDDLVDAYFLNAYLQTTFNPQA